MASVHDVVQAVLRKTGEISTMKLQKLVYYCQAWSLVWDDRPLFHSRIEAWANGPVIPDVYSIHRGQFSVASWPQGAAENLDPDQTKSVEIVVDFYCHFNAQQLSSLTHSEAPWVDARRGMSQAERGNVEITHEAMAEYYSSL